MKDISYLASQLCILN